PLGHRRVDSSQAVGDAGCGRGHDGNLGDPSVDCSAGDADACIDRSAMDGRGRLVSGARGCLLSASAWDRVYGRGDAEAFEPGADRGEVLRFLSLRRCGPGVLRALDGGELAALFYLWGGRRGSTSDLESAPSTPGPRALPARSRR